MIKDDELGEIIARLDEGIPKEGAVAILDQYGGGPDEGRIIANKLGYLRLGIEFLKGAFADEYRDKQIKVDLKYLIGECDISFDWFERTEEFPAYFHKPTLSEKVIGPLFPYLVLLIIAGFFILAFIGLLVVVGWLRMP